MPLTPFPPSPSRSDPSTFADLADAYLSHLESPFVAEANALESTVNSQAAICQSAAQAVNVTAWNGSTFYSIGNNVYDTTDFLTYRRKTTGATITRPGLDPTNWQLLTGFGDVTIGTNQTITGAKTFNQPIVGSGASLTNLNASNLSTGAVPAARLPSASEVVAGAVELATVAEAEAGTDNTTAMTPLRTRQATLSALNATGTAPVYACRAWVNFNGTGTVAIRASGNVSSITDNGTGDYTVNFTTAMPDANYAVCALCNEVNSSSTANFILSPSRTASSVDVITGPSGSKTARVDVDFVSVAIFR